MVPLQSHVLNAVNARAEWNHLDSLLKSKKSLGERADVLPFFRTRHDISILSCYYVPRIKNPNRIAHEFRIQGDFVADLVVGDHAARKYLLIEFEDGNPESVFKQKAKKANRDWSPRLEAAYSQLVDWLWKLEDMRSTADFHNTFGNRRVEFEGIIILGKDVVLTTGEEDRLKWRMDRTRIDSNKVSIVTFDEYLDDCDHWLSSYHGV